MDQRVAQESPEFKAYPQSNFYLYLQIKNHSISSTQRRSKLKINLSLDIQALEFLGSSFWPLFQNYFLFGIILFMPISVGNNFSEEEVIVKEEPQLEEGSSSNSLSDEAADHLSSSPNIGHWSSDENLKYMIFLNAHKLRFKCRLKRKKIQLFEEMSRFIGSRSPVQCRTHHQKYQSKFGESTKILRVYRESIGKENYKLAVKRNTGKAKGFRNSKKIIKKFSKVKQRVENKQVDVGIQVGEHKVEQRENNQLRGQQEQSIHYYYYWCIPFGV